jgi:hypothetical protein
MVIIEVLLAIVNMWDNDTAIMKLTTTKSALLLHGGMLVLLAVTTATTEVYAQTPPTPTPPPAAFAATPVSAPTQEIINKVHANCSEATPAALASLCVSVVHESFRTLVLTGDLLIVIEGAGGYGDNRYIWLAADEFKAQGHTLDSVLLAGQGSQGNPHKWYIVMSKQ